MHPALSSLLYVLCVVALIALIGLLAVTGSAIAGPPGAITGSVIGMIVLVWSACWFMESA